MNNDIKREKYAFKRDDFIEKFVSEERLLAKEGHFLLQWNDFSLLAMLANTILRRFYTRKRVIYIIDRNFNYTNICPTGYVFQCPQNLEKNYILNREILAQKIKEIKVLGGVQILFRKD